MRYWRSITDAKLPVAAMAPCSSSDAVCDTARSAHALRQLHKERGDLQPAKIISQKIDDLKGKPIISLTWNQKLVLIAHEPRGAPKLSSTDPRAPWYVLPGS